MIANTDLTITFPLALTTSQIIRASPMPISESAALELALELHDLIGEVRAKYVGCSPDDGGFGLTDLIDAVRRTALGFWPYNNEDAVGHEYAVDAESAWLMDQLTDISDALYDRYLRLHDRINATNFAEIAAGEDHPQSPRDPRFPGSTRH